MRQQSKGFSPRAFHYVCAIAKRGRVSPLLAITAVTLSLSAVMGAVLAYDKQGFVINYLGKDVNIEFSPVH